MGTRCEARSQECKSRGSRDERSRASSVTSTWAPGCFLGERGAGVGWREGDLTPGSPRHPAPSHRGSSPGEAKQERRQERRRELHTFLEQRVRQPSGRDRKAPFDDSDCAAAVSQLLQILYQLM